MTFYNSSEIHLWVSLLVSLTLSFNVQCLHWLQYASSLGELSFWRCKLLTIQIGNCTQKLHAKYSLQRKAIIPSCLIPWFYGAKGNEVVQASWLVLVIKVFYLESTNFSESPHEQWFPHIYLPWQLFEMLDSVFSSMKDEIFLNEIFHRFFIPYFIHSFLKKKISNPNKLFSF